MIPEYLNDLNDRQKEAAIHNTGPLMIIAGAGTGKTFTIAQRIRTLIKHHGVNPESILGITFTNKAAKELKERVIRLVGDADGAKPTISTFHSLCAQILRVEIRHHHRAKTEEDYGYTNKFNISDPKELLGFIKNELEERGIGDMKPKNVLAAISSMKNEMISPEDMFHLMEYQFNMFHEHEFPPYLNFERALHVVNCVSPVEVAVIQSIYASYQEELVRNNILDFDDLLFETVRLFAHKPEVLGKYQRRYEYLTIDEYQDSNYPQYMLAMLLSALSRNIAVVGDDAQSIYRFRGADMSIILNFTKDFPEAKVVILDRNYRSTDKILVRANKLIAHNLNQMKKNLWTEVQSDEDVELHSFHQQNEESEFVARTISRLHYSKGVPFQDFAILFRANAQSRSLEDALMREGIPYHLYGGVNFYQRREIKDLICYLSFLQNPSDGISLKRIINTPKRGIGDTTIKSIDTYAMKKGITMWDACREASSFLKPAAASRINDFVSLIDELFIYLEYGVGTLLESIIAQTQFREKMDHKNKQELISRLENVDEFLNFAWEFNSMYDDMTFNTLDGSRPTELTAFIERISLTGQTDEESDDQVALMTVHASKGLEFEQVFLIGMAEEIFPHRYALSDEDVEEERRLGYVGVTRAKQKLHLSFSKNMRDRQDFVTLEPSRFLAEMDFETEDRRPAFKLPW